MANLIPDKFLVPALIPTAVIIDCRLSHKHHCSLTEMTHQRQPDERMVPRVDHCLQSAVILFVVEVLPCLLGDAFPKSKD